MPEVWKDIFRSGTYLDHTGEAHTFTSADVVSAFQNGRAMLRSRIPISAPSIWEHDWTAVPEPLSKFLSTVAPDRNRRAEVAKNTFGWAKDYKLAYEPDAKEGGQLRPVLYALLTAPDAKDLEQLRKTRFVSPRVDWGFRDTLGRVWDGCSVTHIAATHSPVQIDQRPVMLGRPASLKTLFLGAPMAKDDDKGGKKDGGSGGGGNDIMGRLKAACASLGCPIPDSAMSMDDVVLAMETHAMKGATTTTTTDDGTAYDDDGDEGGIDGNVSSAGGINAAMLSTLAPEAREQIEALQKRADAVTASHRSGLVRRFKAVERPAAEHLVLGKDTPKKLADLERRLTGVSLSFTAEGELRTNGAMRELEMLEAAVRAKLPDQGKKSSKVRPVDLSAIGGGVPAAAAPQKPGDPGWDEAVKAATERAVARVSGK